MDKIQQVVSSGEWWFSVVVMGLVMGIVTTYSVRKLDRVLERYGSFMAGRSDQARQRRHEAKTVLLTQRHRIPFAIARRQALQSRAIALALIGMGCLLGSSNIGMAIFAAQESFANYAQMSFLAIIGAFCSLFYFVFERRVADLVMVLASVVDELDEEFTAITASACTKSNDSVHDAEGVSEI